jgi:hypothetical protein
MRTTLYRWLGREFVAISAEARPGMPADQALGVLLDRCAAELARWGLSLDNVVRTRLWGRGREARDLASRERVRVLSGKARSASSSFIAPAWRWTCWRCGRPAPRPRRRCGNTSRGRYRCAT